ncbi:MAG: hypothetical protein LBL48_03235 [Azoarcus sp.]|nr:hypothetical protein [Azoarcus sp.]
MTALRCRALAVLAVLSLLAACENGATSMMIDGRNHAIVLVREQQYFWRDTVEQSIIASRLPSCQRKVKIHPGRTAMMPIEVYETGEMLWALRQGNRWYLVSTEECRVQDWRKPDDQSPGQPMGRFEPRGDKIVFIPVPAPAPQAGA